MTATVIAAGAFALACTEARPTADSELMRDLELASSTGLELALATDAGQTAVVSRVEQAVASTPNRTTPRRAPRRVVEAPEPELAGADVVNEAVEIGTEEASVDAASSDVPAAGRPVPIAVGYPGGGDRAPGPSIGDVLGGIGGVILDGAGTGVVIRGGGVGVDRCERHGTGRRGGIRQPIIGGVLINDRFPIVRPTFPMR